MYINYTMYSLPITCTCSITCMLSDDDACPCTCSRHYAKKICKRVHTSNADSSVNVVGVAVIMVHVYPFLPLTDSSLTHSNLAAVMETVRVGWLGDWLCVPDSVQVKLELQCDNEERRNELISWWLQSSPYALDSWKWLSGQLLYWREESALAAAKRYLHQTPGMSVVN